MRLNVTLTFAVHFKSFICGIDTNHIGLQHIERLITDCPVRKGQRCRQTTILNKDFIYDLFVLQMAAFTDFCAPFSKHEGPVCYYGLQSDGFIYTFKIN